MKKSKLKLKTDKKSPSASDWGQKAQKDRIKKFALFRMSSFAQYGVLGSQTAHSLHTQSSAANGREESD